MEVYIAIASAMISLAVGYTAAKLYSKRELAKSKDKEASPFWLLAVIYLMYGPFIIVACLCNMLLTKIFE